jgi:outer membrane protein assembly factor BamB
VSDWSVYKFNIPTGKLLWRKELQTPKLYSIFNNTSAKLVNNLLVLQSGGDEAYAINVNTGAVVWSNPNAAPNANYHILQQDNMLIFNSWGNGSIVALDPITGKTLFKQRSPNQSISFSGEDVIYDKDSKLYYTSDYKSIFGFKLIKPK